MSTTHKYLDYEGLQRYHNKLVSRLADLEYDPKRMFEDIEELITPSNWGTSKYGRIVGLKEGLIVTVDDKIWQLQDPNTFRGVLTSSASIADKLLTYDTPESLGWKIVGSTVDFDIINHTLQLTK